MNGNSNNNRKTERNYNLYALACISVNYGECVQLIILFLYHLSTPEKKRWDNFFDATSSFFVLFELFRIFFPRTYKRQWQISLIHKSLVATAFSVQFLHKVFGCYCLEYFWWVIYAVKGWIITEVITAREIYRRFDLSHTRGRQKIKIKRSYDKASRNSVAWR